MDPIIGAAALVAGKAVGKVAIDVVKKIDCKLSISSGVSLLTGTPDVTLGIDCSGKKDNS